MLRFLLVLLLVFLLVLLLFLYTKNKEKKRFFCYSKEMTNCVYVVGECNVRLSSPSVVALVLVVVVFVSFGFDLSSVHFSKPFRWRLHSLWLVCRAWPT